MSKNLIFIEDFSKEEIYELFDHFNQAMDPNNEQHVKKRDELQNFIDTRFPKQETPS